MMNGEKNMDSVSKSLRYVYLILLMLSRNIRWVTILAFYKKNKKWRVLDFQMYLNTKGIGLDLKENSIHKQLILDGVREQESTKIMKWFLHPDDVILEVGANIGYYVLIESSILSDQGFIYAVEPALDNIDLLKKNVKLNNVRNIEINNMALSGKKGTAKLYMSKASNFYSLGKVVGMHKSRKYVEVKTDTVDNFLENNRPITFLRMDIEGHEVEVINGMKKTLQSPHLKRMFIEIHPHNVPLSKMQNFLTTLQDNGFVIVYAISHDNFQRSILGQCKIEKMSISELLEDERILKRKNGFEIFFEKVKI